MTRWFQWPVHAVAYLLSIAAFFYLIGFSMNRYAFNTVDSGLQLPATEALVWDVFLLALFALPHSLLVRFQARHWRWRKTLYLLATTGSLFVLFLKWEPVPNLVWSFPAAWWLDAIGWLGWAAALYSAAICDHAHTFGWTSQPAAFQAPGLYRWIRHPQMLGVTLGLWGTRDMSQGHLLLAAGLTAYAWIGVYFEERGLKRQLGPEYLAWRRRTGLLWPRR